MGAPPTTGEGWFRYLPGKSTAWWVILWVSVITDLCYLPVAWALYVVLRAASRELTRAALLLLHLFVLLDLAVTWTHHALILALYRSYVADGDAAHRAAYVAGSEYAASIYGTPLLTFYIIVIPSLGVLLASITMMEGKVRKGERLDRHDYRGIRVLVVDRFFPARDGKRVVYDALVLPPWRTITATR